MQKNEITQFQIIPQTNYQNYMNYMIYIAEIILYKVTTHLNKQNDYSSIVENVHLELKTYSLSR